MLCAGCGVREMPLRLDVLAKTRQPNPEKCTFFDSRRQGQ
jgi:hypothetical protein